MSETAILSHTFTAALVTEGSWGARDLGTHESTMDLYFHKDNTGCIEWVVPSLDEYERIGLWFDIGADGSRTLSDYDGIFSLPDEAIALLREAGVIVPEEFE